jgi:hypothetical protein
MHSEPLLRVNGFQPLDGGLEEESISIVVRSVKSDNRIFSPDRVKTIPP